MDKKVKWFHSLETLNWTRLWWIVGIITTFWLGLIMIIPMNWFKVVSIVLSALQTALLFAARGTKYVVNRTEPPADANIVNKPNM
jgi:hypothetical protein